MRDSINSDTRVIRPAAPGDAGQIAAIYAPIVRETPISFELEPPDAAEFGRRMARYGAFGPWLVCERAGEILAYAYASPHNERAAYQWAVNVSIYAGASARRLGAGRALYGVLFELLRLQGFMVACAGVTLPNAASVGLHEALGFAPVGVYRRIGYKFGRWHDVGWWQMDLQPPPADPPPPLSLAEAMALPAWRKIIAGGD